MKKYIQKKSVLLTLLLLCSIYYGGISQVVLIEPFGANPPTPSASTCQTITVGTTISFERAMNCDANILLTDETGSGDPYVTFSQETFSYTFDQIQLYAFVCGAPSTDLAGGQATICYNVVAVQDIPTLGEWGLIILFVSLLIFGLVMIRQSATKGLKVQ